MEDIMPPRGTNREVIQSWLMYESMSPNSGRLSTDGKTLWSYDLPIGISNAIPNGKPLGKYIGNYSARGDGFHSHTTSEHVGLAITIMEEMYTKEKESSIPTRRVRVLSARKFQELAMELDQSPYHTKIKCPLLVCKSAHKEKTEDYKHEQWQLQTEGDYR